MTISHPHSNIETKYKINKFRKLFFTSENSQKEMKKIYLTKYSKLKPSKIKKSIVS